MSDNGSSKHTKVPIAKETYTADEKKMIMDRLDKERFEYAKKIRDEA